MEPSPKSGVLNVSELFYESMINSLKKFHILFTFPKHWNFSFLVSHTKNLKYCQDLNTKFHANLVEFNRGVINYSNSYRFETPKYSKNYKKLQKLKKI